MKTECKSNSLLLSVSEADSGEPGIRAEGLSHEFLRNHPLFIDLNFQLNAGDLVAVVGPSGSGKSTLLSIIAGWLKPTRGLIVSQNIDRIGWVFQNPHGVSRRTAIDHVALPLMAQGLARKQAEARAEEILSLFSLGAVEKQQFRELSGGEAQRLMLARAVATAPDILLVDEPTAQLDLHTSATVNKVLAGLAREESIVMVATHDPDTRDVCHRVIDLAGFQGRESGSLGGPSADLLEINS